MLGDISQHIKKVRTTVKVVHPIFDQCSTLTDDEMWIQIFKQLSLNKPLKGFVVQNNVLKYRKGKKVFTLPVPSEPQQAFLQCKNFIKVNGSIFSDRDLVKIDCVSTDNRYTDVKLLKKNKEALGVCLENYAKKSTSTDLEYRCLSYILNLIVSFNILETRDIVFEDEEIKDVKIVLKNAQGNYMVCPERMESYLNKKKPSSKVTKKFLGDTIWTKYLTTLFKQ